MATAEQLKSLIQSHFTDDVERFYTIALQVAAHEARQGHMTLGHDIRTIVDKERKKKQSSSNCFSNSLSKSCSSRKAIYSILRDCTTK